ncbi:MAG: TetR/AcrR family transcriptional regulator [Granulosicoccus sp.]
MGTVSRKEENRLSLLNEGVRIMTVRGYHGTGVKELVDTVGIPKGSFYQYFVSKENFCAEAVDHYINPYIESLQQHIDNKPGDALAALRNYFAEQTVAAAANNFQGGCLLGNLLGEIGEAQATCHGSLRNAVERYCRQIQIAFELAQNENTVTQEITATEMSNTLFCAWQGALLRMKVEQSVWPLESCLESLLNNSFYCRFVPES